MVQDKRTIFRDLVDRVLDGDGRTPREQRAQAFGNTGPAPVRELVDKVATRPTEVTDADFATARAAGFGEDELVELVIAAAVGQSARQYDAGRAALAEATRERG
ncbi:hypothetical protein [Nocardia mikamii]|uniref:hypothetical protein n=1 Tax=Nocardia mikamii TaxID=508464 RepID=UPI0007C69E61|nr:hypothetical protein [Nocardia mikamii]